MTSNVQLPIEFDPYKDSSDLPIELLAIKQEKWPQIDFSFRDSGINFGLSLIGTIGLPL